MDFTWWNKNQFDNCEDRLKITKDISFKVQSGLIPRENSTYEKNYSLTSMNIKID